MGKYPWSDHQDKRKAERKSVAARPMRTAPIQRTPIKKSQNPIKKRSDKRAAQEKEYTKVRKAYLKANPLCGAKLNDCALQANQVHHKRGRIGELLTDTKYFLACCDNCHKLIEKLPAMAKEKGLSVLRLQK